MLESGEFLKVGSSKVQKTDVRIIAATNKDLLDLSQTGRFREDLYYRLSTVPIKVPPLRERKEDIGLLFRKFSADFAEKYRSKPVILEPDALQMMINFRWPGNIRQLKNIAEQLSVLDEDKIVSGPELHRILPPEKSGLPMVIGHGGSDMQLSERDIMYKFLLDLRKDLSDLKAVVYDMMQGNMNNTELFNQSMNHQNMNAPVYTTPDYNQNIPVPQPVVQISHSGHVNSNEYIDITESNPEPESLSLEQKEIELIRKSLKKHNGKRKKAAQELGISERTLYRKIKQYDLED
jgi:DNA-binding NtrC family response regulator